MMRILLICADDLWSMGQGRGAVTIDRALRAYDERGFEVYVISADSKANRGQQGWSRLPGFSKVYVRRIWLPQTKALGVQLPRPLRTLENKLRFAVLFPIAAALEGAKLIRRRKVDLLYGYDVHGILAVRLLHNFWPLPSVARHRGTVLYPVLRRPDQLARKFDHLLALKARADLYIMTDDGTLGDRVLRALNPSSPTRLFFWRNGIDLEELAPGTAAEMKAARRRIGILPDSPVLLMTVRLVRWKRVDRAIRVLPKIVAQENKVQLIVAGDGEELRDLERLAKSLGVDGNVSFLGGQRRDQIIDLMRAADVFLSLNDLSNGGNPLMEAMSSGKAIITLDTGSTKDLINDGVTGMLLKPDDDGALVQAVLLLLANARLRQRLGERARRFAVENFWTWEARMESELDIVSGLVGAEKAIYGAK